MFSSEPLVKITHYPFKAISNVRNLLETNIYAQAATAATVGIVGLVQYSKMSSRQKRAAEQGQNHRHFPGWENFKSPSILNELEQQIKSWKYVVCVQEKWNAAGKDVVVLHMPLRALDCPNPSPFPVKLETWLRMNNIKLVCCITFELKTQVITFNV